MPLRPVRREGHLSDIQRSYCASWALWRHPLSSQNRFAGVQLGSREPDISCPFATRNPAPTPGLPYESRH